VRLSKVNWRESGVIYIFFMEKGYPNFTTSKGWVMVKNDGTIWLETFANTNIMCWAIASEAWALDGETKKDHPEWRPRQGVMTVVLL